MHRTAAIPATIIVAMMSAVASGGVLLSYGTDSAALNDAGVIRSADNPNDQFGFTQFQLFNIDSADVAWRLDSATVTLRVWNALTSGDATLAIYGANGLVPDLLDKRTADLDLSVDSLSGESARVRFENLVLEAGNYFVAIEAASPTAELLWLAGTETAFRTAQRSDGGFFTGSSRALSLTLAGEVVPAPGGVALLGMIALPGVLAPRRRR